MRVPRHHRPVLATLGWLAAGALAVGVTAAGDRPFPDRFTLFESGQVRPLALSPDGRHLYAVNTPDNRLEVFELRDGRGPHGALRHVGSVQVGLEPVAVAARDDGEVWVVNHLSDSVSIVDVRPPQHARVVRTLLVGDEPRDVVFAGTGRGRAFVTTAHRGQNHPLDPQLTTPGVGRADVWVFDAGDPGGGLGGTPLAIVTLFADTPRALATSPDGATVYAAAFHSGNRTTSIEGLYVTDGGEEAPDGFGLPAPNANFEGLPQPEEGLIVKFDGEHWRDRDSGRSWDHLVSFSLPDLDVFAIDADADPPALLPGGAFAGVGTVLFNMAVNPATGKLYVANTEAVNEARFEGPGEFAGSTVRGHLHESRVTVIDGGRVMPRHLNKHIDYDACCAPLPNPTNDASLAQPLEMAVSADGATLYLAAFGSGKIGVFSTAELEDDSFVPGAAHHIELSGGGPTGVVLDEARGRLYVLTRFDNTVSAVDLASRREIARRPLFNPEPEHVVAGRRFLYDARLSSANGEASCGSCHLFGDLDSLAWDLGDPDGETIPNPGPLIATPPVPGAEDFHPMKGPMTTQSLRGMANHGPMHWRGDRNGNNEVAESAQPDTGLFDERQAFREFNPAFEGLLGRSEQLTAAEMEAFVDFVLEITYPPNPIRNLDNRLTESQARGRDHFFRFGTATLNPPVPDSELSSCGGCHVLDPGGNAEFGVARPGFFGTDGRGVVETSGLQHVKVPHFRNMYQKVGMFGLPPAPVFAPHGDFSHQGDQVRGFGMLHNGAIDTIFRFISIIPFSNAAVPEGFGFGPEGDPARRDVEAFILAFDSNLAPIVGQQVTLTRDNAEAVAGRVDLLLSRASTEGGDDPHAPECELVATTRRGGLELGFLYLEAEGVFRPSAHDAPYLTAARLRRLAHQGEVTFTCVPLGSGVRVALDADLDGCFNASEVRAGYDPRDAASTPPGCGS